MNSTQTTAINLKGKSYQIASETYESCREIGVRYGEGEAEIAQENGSWSDCFTAGEYVGPLPAGREDDELMLAQEAIIDSTAMAVYEHRRILAQEREEAK